MRLLLDTHVLLWSLADDPKLGPSAKELIANSANEVYVSAASAWEISIKRALGKLQAPADLEEALRQTGLQALPITIAHAWVAGQLPRHHEDPFDRMLIAQTAAEKLTLITADARLQSYPVPIHLVA